MRRRFTSRFSGRLAIAAALATSLACASTELRSRDESAERLPRPERIVVHPFATQPGEVRLDHSVTASAWRLKGVSETSERSEVAHAVSSALADQLVKKIQSLGLPAERADVIPPDDGRLTLVIDGQFLSINQGSRTERVVVGLGAGRSEVRTAVQVYEWSGATRRVVDQFEVDAKSGAKPGMAETMGAGAAAGNLAESAAVSAAAATGTETFGDDVDADARRTASEIAKALESLFRRQGWLAAGQP